MKIKHVSLDLWNTLITSNPTFRDRRDQVLASFAPTSVRLWPRFKQYVLNSHDPSESRLERLVELMMLADARAVASADNVASITDELERLYVQYAPTPDKNTLRIVVELNRRLGTTFSVGSNVGLVRGSVMRSVVQKWDAPIDFCVFDDEEGSSKPSEYFFQQVITRATELTRRKPAWASGEISPGNILHVGDDEICDGGCVHLGMEFLHVTNSAQTADRLKQQFEEQLEELNA